MSRFSKFISAISPIDLFQNAQLRKLAAEKGFQNKANLAGSFIQGNMRNVARMASTYGRDAELNGLSGYFSGRKIGERFSTLDPKVIANRKAMRKNFALGVGGYLGMSMMLPKENPIRRTVDFGVDLGINAGITYGLNKISPMAAIAYGGIGLINSIRAGDNWGGF